MSDCVVYELQSSRCETYRIPFFRMLSLCAEQVSSIQVHGCVNHVKSVNGTINRTLACRRGKRARRSRMTWRATSAMQRSYGALRQRRRASTARPRPRRPAQARRAAAARRRRRPHRKNVCAANVDLLTVTFCCGLLSCMPWHLCLMCSHRRFNIAVIMVVVYHHCYACGTHCIVLYA